MFRLKDPMATEYRQRRFGLLTSHYTAALLIALSILQSSVAQDTNNWTEFRGSMGNGHASVNFAPSDLSNIQWKVPIKGKGWSSPVVWQDQVWLTTATEDGKEMSAICVDINSGETIYDLLIHENETPSFSHPTNSYASPTPVIEEGRVYLHFGSYGTTCIDTSNGKQLWQRTDFECNHHRGPASSPILYKGKLIIAFDGFDQTGCDFIQQVSCHVLCGRVVRHQIDSIGFDLPHGINRIFVFVPENEAVIPVLIDPAFE